MHFCRKIKQKKYEKTAFLSFSIICYNFLFSRSNNMDWFRNFGSAQNTDAWILKSYKDENRTV